MPNPPTFNDLRRQRSSSGKMSRRFVVAGVNISRPQTKLTLNAFVSPNAIGVNSINTLGASNALSFAVSLLYNGQNTNNTVSDDNLIFYPGNIEVNRILDTPFNKSLWSINDEPVQLSNNLSYPLPSNNFTLKEEFYNEENSSVSSKTLVVSTIIFSETEQSQIQKYNFTSTNTITITSDNINNYGRIIPICFDITLLDTNNKTFIENSLLLIDPISAYKDGVFLKTLNEKYFPNLMFSKPVTAVKENIDHLLVNEVRQYSVQPATNRFFTQSTGGKLPLSSINITTQQYLSANYTRSNGIGRDRFRYSLGSFDNDNFKNGLVVFKEYLSSGLYEFKINVRDKNNSQNAYSNTVSLNVNEVYDNMPERSLTSLIQIISGNPTYTNKTHYKVLSSANALSGGWSSDFWGFSARDVLNFSGVCWNSRAAQSVGEPGPQDRGNITATLITPRHAVAAEHYFPFESGSGASRRTQAWQKGDHIYFYDHTTGQSVSAEVENEMRLANLGFSRVFNPYTYSNFASLSWFYPIDELSNGLDTLSGSTGTIITDCQLLYLNKDITSEGDIKVYPLSRRNTSDWPIHKYPVITTSGRNVGSGAMPGTVNYNAGIAMTSDVPTTRSEGDNSTFLYETGPNLQFGPPRGSSAVSMQLNQLSSIDIRIPETYSFGQIVDGDSGSPNFLLIDNELCLYMCNYTAGGIILNLGIGPDYGNVDTQVLLQSAIDVIGNTEGYKLSTIDVI